MKTTLSLALLTAVSILAPAQGRPTSYNVLLDPGFENTAHPNWDNSGSTTINPDGSFVKRPLGRCVDGPHGGSYSWDFMLGYGSVAYGFLNVCQVRQNFAAFPTSQATNVSFWAASDGATIHLILYYSDGSSSGASYAIDKNAFQYVNATSAVLPGKSLVGIGFLGYDPIKGTYLFVDDANVTRKVAGY